MDSVPGRYRTSMTALHALGVVEDPDTYSYEPEGDASGSGLANWSETMRLAVVRHEPVRMAAVAISLGLDEVAYEPEAVPGVQFRVDAGEDPGFYFEPGHVVGVGFDADSARTVLEQVCRRIGRLYEDGEPRLETEPTVRGVDELV